MNNNLFLWWQFAFVNRCRLKKIEWELHKIIYAYAHYYSILFLNCQWNLYCKFSISAISFFILYEYSNEIFLWNRVDYNRIGLSNFRCVSMKLFWSITHKNKGSFWKTLFLVSILCFICWFSWVFGITKKYNCCHIWV